MGPHPTLRGAAAAPRGVALIVVAVYLGASGTALAADGNARAAWLHVLLIGVTLITIAPRSAGLRLLGDVLPLIVMPALYLELPRVIAALGSTYHDVTVQQLERAVFGGQPSRTFALAVPSRLVSELLHAGYVAYYPLIYVPPLLLLVQRRRAALGRTVLGLTVTYVVCWVAFAFFPVQGPRFLWGAANAPDGPIRRFTLAVLNAGSSRGTAFPSSHMAVSVAQAVAALRYQRTVGWVAAGIAGLVGFGAVYGGFHYGVDILTGAALGAGLAAFVTSWRQDLSAHR